MLIDETGIAGMALNVRSPELHSIITLTQVSNALGSRIDSRDYEMVENGHRFMLHNVADRLRLDKSI